MTKTTQLTDICVSKEWAEKLKEAGFNKETLFSYVLSRNDGKTYVLDYNESCGCCSKSYNGQGESIPAPLAEEILGELPGIGKNLTIIKVENGNFVISFNEDRFKRARRLVETFNDKNLSDALAKMWLYLKTQGLLPSKE